ncbi:hypothetical protein Tco_0717564 [Tanacetum coccineum]
MEKKDTVSSCSESEEQQMQLIKDNQKKSCYDYFQRLHSHLTRLSNNDLKGSRTENGFGRRLQHSLVKILRFYRHDVPKHGSTSKKQIDPQRISRDGSWLSFESSRDTVLVVHQRYDSRVNERQIQTTEEKIDTSNALDALDASSVIIESNGTESQEQDTSSRSGNDAHVDDADIRPI